MKNKSLFSRLLDNKKLVLVLSLLLSFFFWIVSSDNTAKTVTDVVLNYSLSDTASKELKIFSSSVNTVSVHVAGKRVIVDALSAEDITATIDLSSVNQPCTGTYPVIIDTDRFQDFDVESIEPESVTVMVDREISKTVEIISDFTYSPEGYYVDHNAPKNIEITGPETIVKRVHAAYISGNVSSPNAGTVTNSYNVRLFESADPTADGAVEIPTDFITMSYSAVDVSFRFLKIDEEVPFTIKYDQTSIDLPSSYYSVTPSTISVAGPEDKITGENAIESFAIDIGSLSQYKNQIYNLTFDVNDILGTDFVNKSDGVETIKVQLDFSYLDIETFDVPASRISVKDLPEGYTYKTPSTYAVTVVGTSAVLDRLDENDFTIEYDFSDIVGTSESYVDVPVSISFESAGICWVYRSSETVSVLLEPVS